MIILLKVLIDSEYTFVYITVCYSDTANLNSVLPLYAILISLSSLEQSYGGLRGVQFKSFPYP